MVSQIILAGLVGAFLIACYCAWSFAHGIVGRIDHIKQIQEHQAEWNESAGRGIDLNTSVANELLLRTDLLAEDRGQEFYTTDPVEEKVKVVQKAQAPRLSLRKAA
jgi:hypothetical protein